MLDLCILPQYWPCSYTGNRHKHLRILFVLQVPVSIVYKHDTRHEVGTGKIIPTYSPTPINECQQNRLKRKHRPSCIIIIMPKMWDSDTFY